MSDLGNKAKEIFWGALDQSDDLEAFINKACGDDAELRQRVQALLDAHREAGDFLAPSNIDPTIDSAGTTPLAVTQSQTAEPKPAGQVGPYKLLEAIGEGGMGSVWVAQQSKPIKRKVAIKLIKAGMDSRQVLARFEAERQALSMMDHPNIARVLDAGMTEQGRPYFAMEYVKGVPLTEYCDQAKLSVKERLQLFLPICNAVQHAHQKGIIHRDLKPSNILVCLYDGKPVPKVIDFGLAKAMHHSLTEQSLYTAHGMMVGTPLYMSPEQAEHNNLDIDTRTDVYALGVILYELLTGSTPLEKATMKQAAVNEILRLIKEVDPPKPSTRLSGSDSLPSVAAQRSIDPAHLTRSLTGDLDWVVMKALEKERSRRYETATGLAEDIRRHLSDEPVSASPPSARYRMRKFIKRNRVGVIAASAIAVALLLGVVGTTSGMFWALSEKRAAIAVRLAESKARQEAITSAESARAEAVRATTAEKQTAETLVEVAAERDAKELARKDAEDISKFLGEVFQSPDPERDGREIKVVELLDTAAKKLETDLAAQPAQRAKLQATLGKTYYALGLARQAIPLQEKVRDFYLATSGPEHTNTLNAMHSLASSYHDTGRRDEALNLNEEVVALRRKLYGPEHTDTLKTMSNLSTSYHDAGRRDEALKLREELLTLSRKVHGPEHPQTVFAMLQLASSYFPAGRLDEALKLREEALTLSRKVHGPEHPKTVTAMTATASSYLDAARFDEALQLREEVLTVSRRVFGPEHPYTVHAMTHLASSYWDAAHFDEAIKLQEEVLTLSRKVLGPEHPTTVHAMLLLAYSYFNIGRRDEALKMEQEVLTLRRKLLGPEHPETVSAMQKLAHSYFHSRRRDEALQLREEVLTLCRKISGPEHPDTLKAMSDLGISYFNAGRRDEALKLREEVLTLYRKVCGPEHLDTLRRMHFLAESYFHAGRQDEAIKMHEEVLELMRKVVGMEHHETIVGMNFLAESYFHAGRHDEALKLREELLTLCRKVLGPETPNTLSVMRDLGISYFHAGRRNEALQLREEVLTLCRKVLGPEQLITVLAMSDLAISYFHAGRRDETVALWKSVIELTPNSPQRLNDAAWLLAITPDKDGLYTHTEQALEWARKANELAPNNAGLLNTLGVALYRAELWSEAIESLNSSIKHGADVPHNWLFIAMAHHQLKQETEAAKWLDKSLAWKQANEPALLQDTELQSFFAEAKQLMAPDADPADAPTQSDPKESSSADLDGTEECVGTPNE